MDNAILELCDSCDYFASPLLVEMKQINLTVPFKKELAFVSSVSLLSNPEESSKLDHYVIIQFTYGVMLKASSK